MLRLSRGNVHFWYPFAHQFDCEKLGTFWWVTNEMDSNSCCNSPEGSVSLVRCYPSTKKKGRSAFPLSAPIHCDCWYWLRSTIGQNELARSAFIDVLFGEDQYFTCVLDKKNSELTLVKYGLLTVSALKPMLHFMLWILHRLCISDQWCWLLFLQDSMKSRVRKEAASELYVIIWKTHHFSYISVDVLEKRSMK